MMTSSQTTKALAKRFVERSESLELKGKKRDVAALDYFVGAATLADLSGDASLANHLGVVCALIISVRGFIGVKDLLREA